MLYKMQLQKELSNINFYLQFSFLLSQNPSSTVKLVSPGVQAPSPASNKKPEFNMVDSLLVLTQSAVSIVVQRLRARFWPNHSLFDGSINLYIGSFYHGLSFKAETHSGTNWT